MLPALPTWTETRTVWRKIFVAPEADFERLEPIYQSMVKSVQFR